MITEEDKERIRKLRVSVPRDQVSQFMIFDEFRELNKNIKELVDVLK